MIYNEIDAEFIKAKNEARGIQKAEMQKAEIAINNAKAALIRANKAIWLANSPSLNDFFESELRKMNTGNFDKKRELGDCRDELRNIWLLAKNSYEVAYEKVILAKSAAQEFRKVNIRLIYAEETEGFTEYCDHELAINNINLCTEFEKLIQNGLNVCEQNYKKLSAILIP